MHPWECDTLKSGFSRCQSAASSFTELPLLTFILSCFWFRLMFLISCISRRCSVSQSERSSVQCGRVSLCIYLSVWCESPKTRDELCSLSHQLHSGKRVIPVLNHCSSQLQFTEYFVPLILTQTSSSKIKISVINRTCTCFLLFFCSVQWRQRMFGIHFSQQLRCFFYVFSSGHHGESHQALCVLSTQRVRPNEVSKICLAQGKNNNSQ